MRKVEMAVVISLDNSEEEEKKFAAQGLDIKPHRQKMNTLDANGHDLEYRFKDPDDPFQLVFVCAMWLTGFDAKTVSTIYLDKPMKGHTLMQAIARANRVTSHLINGVVKTHGEVVDYYNVFRNMRRALADYALGSEGQPEESPVQDKSALFTLLDHALEQGREFCAGVGIDLQRVFEQQDALKNIELFKEFADILLERDERRKEFVVYENTITALYEACKPEILWKDASRPFDSAQGTPRSSSEVEMSRTRMVAVF